MWPLLDTLMIRGLIFVVSNVVLRSGSYISSAEIDRTASCTKYA